MESTRGPKGSNPLTFPVADVPLVGQPAKVGPWFFTLTVLCGCGAVVLIVGQPGARSGCPSCGKVYELRGMPTLTGGRLAVPLGVGQSRDFPSDPSGS
jgi:hypothetical protein